MVDMGVLVIAAIVIGIGLATFLATRVARLIRFLRSRLR